MIVMQLAPFDHRGGACRIAWYLFEGYKRRGVETYLAVREKTLNDPRILRIDHARYQRSKLLEKVHRRVNLVLGREHFHYPGTREIPHLASPPPDLLHAHNLQGRFFDLRMLPWMSQNFPTVLTLHDTWLLSGYCAYAVDCERWRDGCGRCPDLASYPAVRWDATGFNWRRKRKIFRDCRLYLSTPSRWLMEQVDRSILGPAVAQARVIYNGVDTAVYRPAAKEQIRQELGIPEEAFVVLYVVASHMRKNPYKDYATVEGALNRVAMRMPAGRRVVFLGLGEGGEREVRGNLEKQFIPYQRDIRQVAKYYQAADVSVHAARADTFPNVVLEALACGTPVVATAVGGIPEQIIEGKTGSLVPPGDSELMAQRIIDLMGDPLMVGAMSTAAVEDARARFSHERMVDDYLDFYATVLAEERGTAPPGAAIAPLRNGP